MKIKSKLNGEVRQVRPDIAREMVAMGVAEIVDGADGARDITVPNIAGFEKYSLPQPYVRGGIKPKWEVIRRAGLDRHTLAIQMTIGHQVTLYTGRPDAIRLIGGWPCPDDIRKDYAYDYERFPDLRDDDGGEPESKRCPANEAAATAKKRADELLRDRDIALRG